MCVWAGEALPVGAEGGVFFVVRVGILTWFLGWRVAGYSDFRVAGCGLKICGNACSVLQTHVVPDV